MSNTAIKFENISKQYRLGTIGTGTLSHDLNRWWTMNIRGKEDPYLKIGQVNDRASKASGDFVWALKDINLEVKQGEVLGIIGKNGAGKSTLLKILSRVTTPTTGRITAYGRIASLLEVGTGFHPEMTGRENIFMNGSIMGMTKAEIKRKFDEIVDFAGIEKYIDTPVKRYSSGMTVRLGFAIAAHLEPEILVVDEVLAVGDAEFQKKAIGKMQDVSTQEGRTVLFVSHNMQVIKTLCDYAILLKSGMQAFQSTPEVVCSFYFNQLSELKEQELIQKKSSQVYIANVKAEVKPVLSEYNFFLKIDFTLISNIEYAKGLSLGFSLHDDSGATILISYSGPNKLFNLDKGKNSIKAEIENFPMTPGTYTIRARLESNGQSLDWPKGDLAYFTLEMPKNLFGYRPECLTNGRLFIQPKWSS